MLLFCHPARFDDSVDKRMDRLSTNVYCTADDDCPPNHACSGTGTLVPNPSEGSACLLRPLLADPVFTDPGLVDLVRFAAHPGVLQPNVVAVSLTDGIEELGWLGAVPDQIQIPDSDLCDQTCALRFFQDADPGAANRTGIVLKSIQPLVGATLPWEAAPGNPTNGELFFEASLSSFSAVVDCGDGTSLNLATNGAPLAGVAFRPVVELGASSIDSDCPLCTAGTSCAPAALAACQTRPLDHVEVEAVGQPGIGNGSFSSPLSASALLTIGTCTEGNLLADFKAEEDFIAQVLDIYVAPPSVSGHGLFDHLLGSFSGSLAHAMNVALDLIFNPTIRPIVFSAVGDLPLGSDLYGASFVQALGSEAPGELQLLWRQSVSR